MLIRNPIRLLTYKITDKQTNKLTNKTPCSFNIYNLNFSLIEHIPESVFTLLSVLFECLEIFAILCYPIKDFCISIQGA